MFNFNKKITFYILFLGIILIPNISFAADYWYYATTPEESNAYHCDDYGNSCFEGATGQQKCNAERSKRITNGIAQNKTWKITACVKLSKAPPVKGTELNSPFEELSVAGQSVEQWWYIYKFLENSQLVSCQVSGPFVSSVKCVENRTVIVDSTHILLTDCKKSNTKLIEPGECHPNIVTPISSVPGAPTKTVYNTLAVIDTKNVVCIPDPTGKTDCIETNQIDTTSGFGPYLNTLIKIFIAICAVLAMVMIVYGGIEYMTGELISEKADGKGKIMNAIFGLILALGAYAILNTINPDLLDVSLGGIKSAVVTEQEGSGGSSGGGGDPGGTEQWWHIYEIVHNNPSGSGVIIDQCIISEPFPNQNACNTNLNSIISSGGGNKIPLKPCAKSIIKPNKPPECPH